MWSPNVKERKSHGKLGSSISLMIQRCRKQGEGQNIERQQSDHSRVLDDGEDTAKSLGNSERW